ncbi:O-succinylhomoserine sulfhydrylase [Rhodospirillum rubrum]|uniref:O-succinylhomoserine sulfhydrylase n=1 Tax=Rhodospirillum rubrum TaxID=1085 RepID=UPI001904B523|nr:O-succinylhomoserine sulfhydrylase [Rhodospirillum rubrum]MBK1663412.1 O-succinylhomoserine sulfhydrylase [Rhodospirillum rubrum]MBK1675405.1 O-succinylhomoserine sulfhydrylase [Rhodospirillum rubrum]
MPRGSDFSPAQSPSLEAPAGPATWRPDTLLVRGGLARTGLNETSEALFLNSGYVYPNAEEAEAAFDGTLERYVYSRFRNPTISVFEERLAALEGAPVCKATASGMAAVTSALLCQVRAGDRVVAARDLFGSCSWVIGDLLAQYGVKAEFVDTENLDAWAQALAKPTRAVFLETPSNPTLRIVDLKGVCDLAHAAGATVVVDNAFATPLLQRPRDFGADVVVHSATKWIDGQGRCLGGAVLCDEAFNETYLGPFLRHTGPCLAPFNAWVMLKGLETLSLRINRHSATALTLAGLIEGHPAVARALYPGLASHPRHALAQSQMKAGGGVIALSLKGGRASAYRFLNALSIVDISNNLGDAKSLACHPWTTTHQRLSPEEKLIQGIDEGLIRFSVGLEDPEDLAADIGAALDAAGR